MKKVIMAVAIVCAAAFANAATVGWSCAGLTNYAGDAYSIFVIGQNGVTDVATVTALLDAGSDISGYQFASGTVLANGNASAAAASSGKTLGEGSYTSFMVLFDTTEAKAGTSNYLVLSGATGQTKAVGPSTTTISFTAGNQGNYANNSANWNSFGSADPSVPEPTSGLLLLLGMAGLALKRKVA